jgi:hypothetical protein
MKFYQNQAILKFKTEETTLLFTPRDGTISTQTVAYQIKVQSGVFIIGSKITHAHTLSPLTGYVRNN